MCNSSTQTAASLLAQARSRTLRGNVLLAFGLSVFAANATLADTGAPEHPAEEHSGIEHFPTHTWGAFVGGERLFVIGVVFARHF